jgi:hypothetical protein
MSSTKPIKSAAITFGVMCLVPLACFAQGSPGNTIEVVSQMPKPGMTAKFEQGVKEVDAYAQSHGDTTGTQSFEVRTGPDAGEIDILVPFNWADQDHPPSYMAGVNSTAVKSVEPYTSYVRFSLMDLLPNLGSPAPASAPPTKYFEVIDFVIKPGRMGAFLAAVRQITDAEHTKNPQPTSPVYIYAERSGGDANAITVAIGHPSMADFARPGKSIPEVLREAYGEDEATVIWEAFENSIASEHNFIAQFRPDLSLTPNGQGQ